MSDPASDSAVGQARAVIVALIRDSVAEQPWRVHDYPPAQVASPCVWVDFPTLQRDSPFILGTFPVVVVIDGADAVQARGFDSAVARLWDALTRGDDLRVTGAAPIVRDIGGPTSRAYVLSVEADLSADVLCTSPMFAASTT